MNRVILIVCLLAAPRPAFGLDEVTIEARDFDDGNVRVSLTGEAYADGPSCIWHGGVVTNGWTKDSGRLIAPRKRVGGT